MKTFLVIALFGALVAQLHAAEAIGPQGKVGCLDQPKVVHRLEITEPGVHENYRVDAQGKGGNIVKITADDVVLRNCEIFNSSGNGIGVFGNRVVIENCHIHHLLKGTFEQQDDAHGITGRWGEVTIRHCEISHTSGDCIQFDPDRASRGRVTVEYCDLWSGPLAEDSGGFKAGESPGENAFDAKTPPDGERCRLTLRHCYLHGWNQPSQIQNRAALNLKEHIEAEITNCVFDDNEIALRIRGPGGRGDARVTVKDCAIYRTQVGIRAEDQISHLKLQGLAYAPTVTTRLERHNGKDLPEFESIGEWEAPPMATLLKDGFPAR